MKEIKNKSVPQPELVPQSESNMENPTLPTERIRYHEYRGEYELIQALDSLIDFISNHNLRPESDLGKALERAKELSEKSKLSGSEPNLSQQEVLEVIKTLETFKKNPSSKTKDRKPVKNHKNITRMIGIVAAAGVTKRKE